MSLIIHSRVFWALVIVILAHIATLNSFDEDNTLLTVTLSTVSNLFTMSETSAPSTTTTTTTTDEKKQSLPTYPAVPQADIDSFKPLQALVLGATGQTGRHVVRRLAESPDVTSVTAIVRKEAKGDIFEIKDDSHKAKVTQKVVDFEKLDEYEAAFSGVNAVFNCLGSTRAKAGSAAAFRHIDYGYSYNSAHLIRRLNPNVHYTLLTSGGANAKSSFLYLQVKGQLEEAIKGLGFQRYSIFRPGMLLTEREESRKTEWIFQKIVSGLDFMLPQKMKGTTTDRVAESMVVNALRAGSTQEAYESAQLRQLHVGRESTPAASQSSTSTPATTTTTATTSTPASTETASAPTEHISPPK